jgi:hypothetical protein
VSSEKYEALVTGSIFVGLGVGCICYHWSQDLVLDFGVGILAAVASFVAIYTLGFRGFKQ